MTQKEVGRKSDDGRESVKIHVYGFWLRNSQKVSVGWNSVDRPFQSVEETSKSLSFSNSYSYCTWKEHDGFQHLWLLHLGGWSNLTIVSIFVNGLVQPSTFHNIYFRPFIGFIISHPRLPNEFYGPFIGLFWHSLCTTNKKNPDSPRWPVSMTQVDEQPSPLWVFPEGVF